MYKKVTSILFLLLCIFIGISLLWSVPVLILENPSSSRVLLMEKVSSGEEFSVRWMHSVELQPWEEIFRIGSKQEIILDRTRFKSFGAGVPSHAGTKTEIKDGYVVFSGINTRMPYVTYGISTFAKHTLSFHKQDYPLYTLVEDGDPIKFHTDQVSLLRFLWYKYLRAASF